MTVGNSLLIKKNIVKLQINPEKKKVVSELKSLAKNADKVWLRALKWNSGIGSYSLLPDFYCLLTSSRAAA